MFPKILACLGFNSNQCEALASGLHPATDFEGKPLPSLHSTLAGKPIAGASVEHPGNFCFTFHICEGNLYLNQVG